MIEIVGYLGTGAALAEVRIAKTKVDNRGLSFYAVDKYR